MGWGGRGEIGLTLSHYITLTFIHTHTRTHTQRLSHRPHINDIMSLPPVSSTTTCRYGAFLCSNKEIEVGQERARLNVGQIEV